MSDPCDFNTCGCHDIYGNPLAPPRDWRERKPPHYRLGEPPTRRVLEGGLRLSAEGARLLFRRKTRGEAVIAIARGASYELLPQTYVEHSPTGMEFGYGGSGPHDAALNILALVVPPKEAVRLHGHFCRDVVCGVDQERGGELPLRDVVDWVIDRYAAEQRDPAKMREEKWMALNDALIRLGDEWEGLALNPDGTERTLSEQDVARIAEIRAEIARREAEQKALDEATPTEG